MSEQPQGYTNLGTLLTIAGGLSFISAILSGFNRRMTVASNLLIFAGVALVLGTQKFIQFLTNPRRISGTLVFLLGFVLILFNRRFFAAICELIGIFILFGGFVPKMMNILQRVPYIGQYFRFALPSFFYRNVDQEELPL
jgi:hypothetical protein